MLGNFRMVVDYRSALRAAMVDAVTNPELTAGWLRKHPRAYCDDCLAKAVPISPRQQVQQITSSLAAAGADFVRVRGECSACGGQKLVTSLRKAAR
jgi:hypothetical protein